MNLPEMMPDPRARPNVVARAISWYAACIPIDLGPAPDAFTCPACTKGKCFNNDNREWTVDGTVYFRHVALNEAYKNYSWQHKC